VIRRESAQKKIQTKKVSRRRSASAHARTRRPDTAGPKPFFFPSRPSGIDRNTGPAGGLQGHRVGPMNAAGTSCARLGSTPPQPTQRHRDGSGLDNTGPHNHLPGLLKRRSDSGGLPLTPPPSAAPRHYRCRTVCNGQRGLAGGIGRTRPPWPAPTPSCNPRM